MKRRRNIGQAEAALVSYTKTKVRFSDVDSMKVVWHGNYVHYIEDGREAFGHEFAGMAYMDMYNAGFTAPIIDMQIQYLVPLRIDDVAVIETRYIDTPAAKLCFEYIVRRESDGQIAAKASTVQVFVDVNGEMSLNNPEFYQLWKERWIRK